MFTYNVCRAKPQQPRRDRRFVMRRFRRTSKQRLLITGDPPPASRLTKIWISSSPRRDGRTGGLGPCRARDRSPSLHSVMYCLCFEPDSRTSLPSWQPAFGEQRHSPKTRRMPARWDTRPHRMRLAFLSQLGCRRQAERNSGVWSRASGHWRLVTLGPARPR